MTAEDFSYFMQAQAEEIRKYKWIESEKAGKDLGANCCHEWIAKYAKIFRDQWESKKNNK
jgi:hypothetical protein